MNSPYDPPAVDNVQTNADDCPPLVRVGVTVFGLLQLGIGWMSFAGIASYIFDTEANPSRYQSLIVPIFMWIISIPVLIASIFVYRRARKSITMLEAVWFNGTSSLPTLGLACVFITPYVTK